MPCLIDESDLSLLKGRELRIDNDGYVVFRGSGLCYLAHAILGKAPQGHVVDHINRVRTDNRRVNLRFVPRTINAQNAGLNKRNLLGIKGVSKSGNKYQARVFMNGVKYTIGVYNTPEEAKVAYDAFVTKNNPNSPTNNQLQS